MDPLYKSSFFPATISYWIHAEQETSTELQKVSKFV